LVADKQFEDPKASRQLILSDATAGDQKRRGNAGCWSMATDHGWLEADLDPSFNTASLINSHNISSLVD